MKNNFGKRLKLSLFLGLSLMIILALIFGLLAITNINVAENLLGWDEYQMVEKRNQLIKLLPTIFLTIFLGILLLLLLAGLLKQVKTKAYWLFTLVLFPIVFLGIGTVSNVLPFDRDSFRTVENVNQNISTLQNKNSFKGKDVQLVSFNIYVQNVSLQSGVYSVARVINPQTNLQDEYWFSPVRFWNKWSKDSKTTPIPTSNSISLRDVEWEVLPEIIMDAEKRIAKQEIYYQGISIIQLIHYNDSEWNWTVGVQDIRDDTGYNLSYNLKGEFLEDRTEKNNLLEDGS